MESVITVSLWWCLCIFLLIVPQIRPSTRPSPVGSAETDLPWRRQREKAYEDCSAPCGLRHVDRHLCAGLEATGRFLGTKSCSGVGGWAGVQISKPKHIAVERKQEDEGAQNRTIVSANLTVCLCSLVPLTWGACFLKARPPSPQCSPPSDPWQPDKLSDRLLPNMRGLSSSEGANKGQRDREAGAASTWRERMNFRAQDVPLVMYNSRGTVGNRRSWKEGGSLGQSHTH
ncbi:hypothetical protein DPX16_6593 [Anabarilius grahami]|uniref:Uncharacterized protein n=1 Tax=Anabarilius grahami TaxID=495550 RepID=A0A3N0XY98_ANAGA|nr:hypothetical protein DPX16_6593 [Anabarilius grahami]